MKRHKYFLTVITLIFFNHLSYTQSIDTVKYENGYLYYREYGNKNFQTVILLTGGPGNSYNQLDGMAITLSSSYHCILLEQRGTGKSIPTPFDSTTISIQAVTKDLRTLMDGLKLKTSIIIGHSWGGMLAMNFAALYPNYVKHLVLIAPGMHKDGKNQFDVLMANRSHTRSSVEEQRLQSLITKIEKNTATNDEILESLRLGRRAYIYANPVPDSIFIKINATRNSKTEAILWKDIFQNFDVSKSLNNYKGKIDIITGRQDVVGFCSYELKQDYPKANLFWINECGHFPMYEQPDQFYKILMSILK